MKIKNIDSEMLERAFRFVDEQMAVSNSVPVHLVVCGGSALIATDLIPRTTSDVDAALNVGSPSYHIDDLKALHPADDELDGACQWTLKQDASSHFPHLLKDMLRRIGYADVADRI